MSTQFEYFAQMGVSGLKEYFSQPQEESTKLEFKSGETKLQGIYKEICALANTDGGVLIYGAPKEKEDESFKSKDSKERRKICSGELDPTKEDKTTDSFIQAILTSITPAIAGIEIKKIIHDKGFIYVLNVPKSVNSPHQYGGVYYIRMGTMSMPAPHGIVQALFNKKIPVQLECALYIHKGDSDKRHDLQFCFRNTSDIPAYNCEAFVSLAGDISQHHNSNVDQKFNLAVLKSGKSKLSKSISFSSSIVLDLWMWYNYFNIYISGEYIYVSVYFWAKDTAASLHKFKVYTNGNVQLLNQEDHSDELKEYDKWVDK